MRLHVHHKGELGRQTHSAAGAIYAAARQTDMACRWVGSRTEVTETETALEPCVVAADCFAGYRECAACDITSHTATRIHRQPQPAAGRQAGRQAGRRPRQLATLRHANTHSCCTYRLPPCARLRIAMSLDLCAPLRRGTTTTQPYAVRSTAAPIRPLPLPSRPTTLTMVAVLLVVQGSAP